MPKAFDDAVKAGAKIRTKQLSDGRYQHIAITKNGKTIAGEVHKKKGDNK